jgi:hypothetical protein
MRLLLIRLLRICHQAIEASIWEAIHLGHVFISLGVFPKYREHCRIVAFLGYDLFPK